MCAPTVLPRDSWDSKPRHGVYAATPCGCMPWGLRARGVLTWHCPFARGSQREKWLAAVSATFSSCSAGAVALLGEHLVTAVSAVVGVVFGVFASREAVSLARFEVGAHAAWLRQPVQR